MRIVRAALLLLVSAISPVALAAPCGGFVDVDDSNPAHAPFCDSVEWMKNRAITFGLTPTLYDPNSFVTRLQMAAFMYRLGFQNAFLQGGNSFGATTIVGTEDNQPLELHVNGSRAMRYEPSAISPNVIGGNPANGVTAGVRGATIGGGGLPTGNTDPNVNLEAPNRVTDIYGTVGGGVGNRAGDDVGTILDAQFATVAGGYNNTASGGDSTVAGGFRNTASGSASTVAGGVLNTASGRYSFAAGIRAQADQDGCFIFANWSSLDVVTCLNTERFAHFALDHGLSVSYGSANIGGGGNSWVHLGDLVAGQAIATWTTASLTNSGVWTNASDRALKDGFSALDAQAVLDRVVNLPITRWHYRNDGPAVEHIGPTAQDFKAAFGLGSSDTGIGTVDADGVALAAIQGLNAKHEAERAAKDAEIASLRAELAEIRSLLTSRTLQSDAARR